MGDELSPQRFRKVWASGFAGWETRETPAEGKRMPYPLMFRPVAIRPMVVELDWTRLPSELGQKPLERVRALRQWCRDNARGDHHVRYHGKRYRAVEAVFQRQDDAALFRLKFG
jgi:hypothetical protein